MFIFYSLLTGYKIFYFAKHSGILRKRGHVDFGASQRYS